MPFFRRGQERLKYTRKAPPALPRVTRGTDAGGGEGENEEVGRWGSGALRGLWLAGAARKSRVKWSANVARAGNRTVRVAESGSVVARAGAV